jgi:chromosome segregation ATPase
MKKVTLFFAVTCMFSNLARADEPIKSSAAFEKDLAGNKKETTPAQEKSQNSNKEEGKKATQSNLADLMKQQEKITNEMVELNGKIAALEESADSEKDSKIKKMDDSLNKLMSQGSEVQVKIDKLHTPASEDTKAAKK